jgi:hypothetical protein
MATKFTCLSITAAFALVSLIVMLVSLDPLLGADPFAGVGLGGLTPAVSVNRALKGDRLPFASHAISTSTQANPAAWPDPLRSPNGLRRQRIPLGCDRAFSPISSPLLANVYRRCTV